MIFIFFLLILNLIILLNLKKISQLLNIYDHPDGKLKIQSKDSFNWWFYFNN